ncbi:MAG: hypothetical protein AAF975_09395, partial [Spirochaetota bacterium]
MPQCQDLYQPVAVSSPDKNQRSVMFSWVLPARHDARRSLDYRLLAELLLGHSGAVLEHPLMRSGWGADLSLGSGLELELQNPVLRVGLSPYKPESGECFRELIFSALEDFCTYPETSVEKWTEKWEPLWLGALNSLEYEEYAVHGGEGGLCALERCLQLAQASHFCRNEDASPEQIFDILQPFAGIATLRSEGLAAFALKVRQYTLDNPHWTLQLFEEVAAQPIAAPTVSPPPHEFLEYQARQDEPEQSAKIRAMSREEFTPLLLPEPSFEYVQEGAIDFFCSSRTKANSPVQMDFYWEISSWNDEQNVCLPLFLDLVEGLGLPQSSYAEVAQQKSLHIG